MFNKLTDADIDRLDETVQRLKIACENEDLAEVVQQDMALHRYILEATGSMDLLAMCLPIDSLITQVSPIEETQQVFETIDANPAGMKYVIQCGGAK